MKISPSVILCVVNKLAAPLANIQTLSSLSTIAKMAEEQNPEMVWGDRILAVA